ncbi:MAG: DUF1553 domain-containing protein [Pirellulaceae bacterium]|nr:DUF1553 domain-containing protein [Pirellulaceae bacterium]
MRLARLGRPWFILVICGVLLPLLGPTTGLAANPPGSVDFQRDIRPILSDNCFQCHGPDEAQRQSELRLDTEQGALGPREAGPAIVPGRKADSPLYARLVSADNDLRMPPAETGKTLTSQQIELIGRWIEQGATWQQHWSLVPPRRPALPAVEDPGWCRNAVDRFVLARLEQAGMRPADEADRATLLRRVTLDLTGLPPTPEELAAFERDRSPAAYERVVERLLQSPHYGERMALPWLDAARYADTSGYQTDGERHMWRWRDWVIAALNANLPYDQFTIEQLAGDLLPNSTLDQLIATGFNRNHRANSEGGIVFDEYLVEYAADRVETTATVWMGLTIGCARCHDHKYDPLRQADFYQLMAYFNNLPERGRVIKYGNSAPLIKAPTPLQAAARQAYEAELAAARRAFRRLRGESQPAQHSWQQALAAQPPVHADLPDQLLAHLPLAGDLKATGAPAIQARSLGGPPEFVAGPRGSEGLSPALGKPDPVPGTTPVTPPSVEVRPASQPAGEHGLASPPLAWALALNGKSHLQLEPPMEFDGFTPLTCSVWLRPSDKPDGTLLSWMDAEDTRAKGLSIDVRGGRLLVQFGPRWLDDAVRVETEPIVQPGTWQHVAVVYDGTQMARGLRIYLDGRLQKARVLLDIFTGTFPIKYPLQVGARGEENLLTGELADVRVYRRALSPREVAVLACPEAAQEIARIPADERSAGQRAKLELCFLQAQADQPLGRAWHALRQAAERLRKLDGEIPTTMIMQDRAAPRETFVLVRGQYDRPGQRVTAGVPACLPPLPDNAPPNRLALARWLVREDHPLTARVAVNRQWQVLFGQGLVKTTEDFGVQGQQPSHPELLDWLAVELMRTGWDVKRLHRLLVTSSTYRQSSRADAALVARDPENVLLGRSSRLRLPAELVRDQALAAGGLLLPLIGGPSVKPYQPEGLWTEIASDSYTQDTGADLYRRGLYTFWKRTVPPPTMATFDATSRETCTVGRARTNTPLQALALMNETAFVEAARGLAVRMLRYDASDVSARLAWGFQLVLGRRPGPEELQVLVRAHERWTNHFRQAPQEAGRLLSVGELPAPDDLDSVDLAAHSLLANLILNLDEAVMRE